MAMWRRKQLRTAASGMDSPIAEEHGDSSINDALTAWFAAFQKPIFDKHWAQLVACVFAAVAILEAYALARLIPLKEKEPMFIEHDERTGAVWVSNRVAERYSPSTANKTYFLKIWAKRLLTIQANPHITLNEDLPLAQAWTTGDAVKQVHEWIFKTDKVADRVAKTPGLTRTFAENSTSYSSDGQTAYMVITLQETVQGMPKPPVQRLLTIGFALLPVKLKESEKQDNPLGMRITSFSDTPYIGPGSA